MEIWRDEVERATNENTDVAIETMTPDEILAFIGETLRQSQQGDRSLLTPRAVKVHPPNHQSQYS